MGGWGGEGNWAKGGGGWFGDMYACMCVFGYLIYFCLYEVGGFFG